MLAAAACGFANAQTTAYTTPVGYETLSVQPGFNYLGLRLQRPVIASGTLAAVTSTSITVGASLNLASLLTSSSTYILEISNANGVTQEFLGSAVSGSVIMTPGDLSSKASGGDSYKVRAAPTLASIFGATNTAGLATGFFGPGGDIVYLPNPSAVGGFDQYYYDDGQTSWADSSGTAVDGAQIAINYADGVIVSADGTGASALTVSGEVKTAKTGYSLAAGAFNYLSSIHPAGATLSSSFNDSLGSIDKGFFGPGGDIFYIPNPTAQGGFDQYYYDDGQSSWADSSGSVVNGADISLKSGILIFNDGDVSNVVTTPPTSYGTN